jgi:tetratricopeptide (TPR) repeat protein
VNENDAKTRMADIERFTPAFPNSRFDEQITQYAMISLNDLKDMNRLVSYGEKTLAANPNSLGTLTLLANAYADDPRPGSLAKSASYAQKTIEVAKADSPTADRSHRLAAGVAHSTLGYVYMKQEKTAAAIPELKSATALLKGEDDQSYALAMYRLGFAYGKLNKVTEAREVLTEAVKISGPVQQPAQDLLAKVNAARAKGK